MIERSNRVEVRNPVLSLPSMHRLLALPPEQREILAEVLAELAEDSQSKAQHSWLKHKAPMAAYWKAVAVYAGHLRRAVRPSDAWRKQWEKDQAKLGAAA